MFKWFCMICKLFFPFLFLLPKLKKHAKHKEKYSLEFRYQTVRNFIKKLSKAEKKSIDCYQKEIIDRPHGGRIYITNHQSMDDICTMVELSKKPIRFISKIENQNVFALGNAAKSIDCFFIDRHDVRQSLKVLKEAALAAQNGDDILLFPEGTRSKTGEVLEFKSALTNLVQMAKVEVVIVALDKTVLSLKKRKYKPFSVQARVCQPISYETFLEHKHDFTTYAHDLLKQELAILRKEQSQ